MPLAIIEAAVGGGTAATSFVWRDAAADDTF